MLDNPRLIDKFLQNYRFQAAKPFLIGDVLDFGGNRGELKKFVAGKYLAVNYNHSVMDNVHCDTIVCLAVVEHIDQPEVVAIFKKFKNILNRNGRIFLTTPARIAKPVLEFMAFSGLIDKTAIAEHKHYWNKREIYALAEKTGFAVKQYRKFQLGFNQSAVLEHN